MRDDAIIEALRSEVRSKTPVELAILFDELSGGRLAQFSLISCFSQAFPKIPLEMLIRLQKWKRVGGKTWSDEDVNEFLADWFPYDHLAD